MVFQKLQIGEVAALLNMTPKAIRHYHSIGLLEEPPRADNGYRLYGVVEIERLQLIGRLQGLGLSLKQIKFILEADDPDAVLSTLLQHQLDDLERTIARLRQQQTTIKTFQAAQIQIATWPTGAVSTASIVREAIDPISTNLTDTILAVEGDVLAHLDRYVWPDGYEEFWYMVARRVGDLLAGKEHQFIGWMHRFLTLPTMDADDLQAQTWLDQLRYSPFRPVMAQIFSVPAVDVLPIVAQDHLQKVVLMTMEAGCSPLQREFVRVMLAQT